MRKIYLLLISVAMTALVNGQITTSVTMSAVPIGGSPFASFDAAITAVNGLTITGPVVVDATAGQTETLAGKITLTATGTSTNTITIQKSGAGANPKLISYTGTIATPAITADGFFVLAGSDYVTIDGIDLEEAAANTTTTTVMEFGYALAKTSATDGAQNNTIKNCTITLNRVQNTAWTAPGHNGSCGIVVLNTLNTAAAALTVTAASGTNSNNKFYTNTIQNCNAGFVFVGFTAVTGVGPSPDPSTFFGDLNNDVGGVAAGTGNTVLNFGGGAATNPATGIFANNQWSFNCSYNTINNNNGAGVNHATTLRGIFLNSSSTSASANCNNNTITVKSGATTSNLTGIENSFGATAAANTININNNTITGCTYTTATTGAFTGITNTASAATVNINNNTLTSNATNATSGTTNLIQNTGAATVAININSNIINGWTFNAATSGALNCISCTAGASTCATSIQSNNIQSITHAVAGSSTHTYITATGTPLTMTVNSNTFTNLVVNTTGSATFISQSYTMPAGGSQTFNNNSIVTGYNKSGAGGTVTLFTTGASSPSSSTANYTNNNFSNITVTGATAITGLNSTDGLSTGASVKTVTGNTFNAWTGGTSTILGINISYFHTGAHSISTNTLTNITGQGTITGFSINASANAATSLTIGSNTITNLTSTGTGGSVTGITCSNTSPLVNINSNTINTFSSTGASSTVTGIAITGATLTNVFQNTIHTLSGSGATSPVCNGISVSSGTAVNVYRNKIYNLLESGATGTTAPMVNGILLSGGGGTGVTAHNNLVGDLRATASTSTDAIRGISVTGATASTTFNVYYNTVYLNASSSGANFGTTGIYHTTNATATTAALNLRNNIIYNTSTAAGTGFTVAYRRSSTTLTNYGALSNNNCFYASATTVSPYFIFYDGTTGYQIAGYKALVTARDASSFTEDPEFQSTTGSSADFLKYKVITAKQVENGGVNIATYTTDYFGTIRAGNGGYAGTGTAPDIGAWELEGIAADLTGPSISYTTLGNTACLTDRTLSSVTISDGSGVNIALGTRPRLYYKKTGNANTFVDNTNATDGWKYVEATGAGGSPFSFTTDYSLLFGGVPILADVIQYFVVAQDNVVPTPNVGINSGLFAATPASVALTAAAFPITGTINSYSLVTPGLSGTVNVGAAETYHSLTEGAPFGLFDAINTSGLSGNLIVNIMDASITEAGSGTTVLNAINYNGCSGGPYTVLIKPNTTATLTGSLGSGSIIRLNGADYVTIDGSNNGSNSRDLTISNTAVAAPTVITLSSLGTGLGATNNTIKNCIITTGVNTSVGYGVSIGGATPGTTGADNDNNTIQNNVFTEATAPVYAIGTANTSTGGMDNLSVTNNSVSFTTTITSVFGMRFGNALNASISNNTISIETSGGNIAGISLEAGFINSTVSSNVISKVKSTAPATLPIVRGIVVGTGQTGSNVTIVNNAIYNIIAAYATTNVGSNCSGILLGATGVGTTYTVTTGGINLYYNSINLFGTVNRSSATFEYGLFLGSVCSGLDIRNNIFANSIVNVNASGTASKSYAIYSQSANTAFSNINLNDYYASGTQAVLGFLGSDRLTLGDWQTATAQDAGSIAANPLFNSNTNLQPQPGSPLVGAGNIAGTGVTLDILGVTRSSGVPPAGSTIGAYESAIDLVGPIIMYTPFENTCGTGARILTATITDVSGVPTSGIGLPVAYFRINAGAYTAATGTFVSGNTYTFSIGAGSVAGDAISYYVVAQDMAGTPNVSAFPSAGAGGFTINPPAAATPPTTPSSYTNQTTMAAGIYGVGGPAAAGEIGHFATLTLAIADYNTKCIAGNVIFALTDAGYSTTPTGVGETFPIIINSNPSADATHTLTIRPDAGITAAITGSVASGAVIKVLGKYVTIDGSNNGSTTRDLTITNSSATTPIVVWMGSTGVTPITNINLKNCILVNGVNTSSAVVILDGASTAAAGYFNNITIQNNNVQKAYIGIYSNAVVATGNGSGLGINSNDLSTTGANAIRYIGVYVQGADGATVQGNTIGNFDGTNNEDDKGIWFATGTVNSTASENKVFNLNYTGTGGYGGHGIYVSSVTASANDRVINNMIANLSGDGWDYTTVPLDNPIGIVLSGTQSGISVYNNSVYFSGNTLNQTLAMSMGVYLGAGSVANIRDNIIVNNLGLLAATGYGSTGVYAVTDNTQFTAINYNDYVVNPTGSGFKYIGQIAASGSTTLAAWQGATAQDANSISVAPVFTSSTDLHLTAANCGIDGRGVPIAGITTDFDGAVRDTGAPDMGADEFTATLGTTLAVTVPGTTDNVTYNVSPTGTVFSNSACGIIDGILPNGGSPVSGLITSKVTVDATVQSYGGNAYVQRHFDITPAVNQSTATARVTLYVLQSEFDAYNAANGTEPDLMTGPADATGIANLRITKYSGNGTAPGNYVPGVATFIDPADADIVWDAVNSWWTITFDVTGFSGFYIHSGLGVLPVSILNFSGYKDGARNQLLWTTSSEQNNRGFEVQRSTDGINYTALGFVNTLALGGNSTTQLNYAYTDNNVTGSRQYYRLRQVNFDGNSKFSNIVLIKGDKPVSLTIDGLFPNPASSMVNVLIAAPNKDKVTLIITDISGRTVLQQIVGVETGSNTLPVDINHLSNGTYVVKLVCSSNCDGVVGKFVKQ